MAMTNRGNNQDSVNHPSHYTQGYCETIYEIYDILGPEGFKSYCLGNWIKYKSRARYKNGDEDLKKADVYLSWATQGLPTLNVKARVKCDGNHGGTICDDPECWLRKETDRYIMLNIGSMVKFCLKGRHIKGQITQLRAGECGIEASIIGEDSFRYDVPLSKLQEVI